MLTGQDVMSFAAENDVKFIRLAFTDLAGRQKNVSVMPEELERALERGVRIDGGSVAGFGKTDLFLRPDPSTMSVVPWRSISGTVIRMVCDLFRPDGTEFEGSGRRILRDARSRAEIAGYRCEAGAQCSFYLFENDAAGQPTDVPLDRGGYLDVAPLDRGEDVRRAICLALDRMNVHPETSRHERGHGQNEIDFRRGDVLTTADNLVAFRWAVANEAAATGLWASFDPKPIADQPGSGLEVNLSLSADGVDLFRKDAALRNAFAAGILARAREIAAFLGCTKQSFFRLAEDGAPNAVGWSSGRGEEIVRIPSSVGDGRVEVRSPDPSCNPYLAFALLLEAGLEGVKKRLALPAEGAKKGAERLPASRDEALALARKSEFVGRIVPEAYFEACFSER